MNRDSLFGILFMFFVYFIPFIYYKILIRYKLKEVGIDISFLNFRQNFIQFNEILFISYNNQKMNIISSKTSFPNPRTVLPISKIYITTSRKANFGFGEKFKGYIIYPRDTLKFYREIKQRIKASEQIGI
jgi:hypothetical protein